MSHEFHFLNFTFLSGSSMESQHPLFARWEGGVTSSENEKNTNNTAPGPRLSTFSEFWHPQNFWKVKNVTLSKVR